MLYLDFDGKVDSAALFYKSETERLDGIDVRELGRNLSVDPIDELERIISKELVPQQQSKAFKYKTVVLDSLTTFSALTLSHIVSSNPGINRVRTKQGAQPGMQDYGILKREFAKLIPGLLSLPCNVVMLGHINTEKDEYTGKLIRGPLMDGSFAKELPIYFKEVWHAYADKDGKRYAQTQADGSFDCRSQIPGLPNPIPLSFVELSKYIK